MKKMERIWVFKKVIPRNPFKSLSVEIGNWVNQTVITVDEMVILLRK